MKKQTSAHCAIVVALVGGSPLAADDVVNIDFNVQGVSEITHSGDDGILSTTGGVLWNGVFAGQDAGNFVTEFDGDTNVGVVFANADSNVFTDAGINDLQDSGTTTFQMDIVGLQPGEMYTFAVYVGQNGGFLLEDAGGTNAYFFGSPGSDGWTLPGSVGNDYFIAEPVEPYEVEDGVWGVRFSLDGAITGMQISGDFGAQPCVADWNGDSMVDTSDFVAYLNDFTAVQAGNPFVFGDPDIAFPIGVLNTADFVTFLNIFTTGCP